MTTSTPILIVLHKHPEWQKPLFAALQRRGVPFAPFDVTRAAFSNVDEEDHAGGGIDRGGEHRSGQKEEPRRYEIDRRRHTQHAYEAEAASEREAPDRVEKPADDGIDVGVPREIGGEVVKRDGAAHPVIDELATRVDVERLVLKRRVM